MTDDTGESDAPAPLALQLAVRLERVDPPTVDEIWAAAPLATIALLDDERSQPGGEWHEAVAAWNGARIRKIVRRGRGSAWHRAAEVPGVTAVRGRAEVRAFVPGPTDAVPEAVAKLQIRSTELPEPEPLDDLTSSGLTILLNPDVAMSWGKRAAQAAHAGQWAWMRSDPSLVDGWDAADRPLTVGVATPELWVAHAGTAPIRIHDGGFTEVPAGTRTAIAVWSPNL